MRPAVVALWLLAVVGGLGGLLLHDTRPGVVAAYVSVWPSTTTLELSRQTTTLVIVLHPQCPCSRVSLGELEVLMAKYQARVRGYAILAAPQASEGDEAYAAIHDLVALIPGIIPIHDPGGRLAATFGAMTSGQVLLFDSSGSLQFSGGITLSRGHGGGNDGIRSLEAILEGRKPATAVTPVFGCSLREAP